MSPTHRHRNIQRATSEIPRHSSSEPATLIFGSAGILALAAGQLAGLAIACAELARGADRLSRELAERQS